MLWIVIGIIVGLLVLGGVIALIVYFATKKKHHHKDGGDNTKGAFCKSNQYNLGDDDEQLFSSIKGAQKHDQWRESCYQAAGVAESSFKGGVSAALYRKYVLIYMEDYFL